MAANGENNPLRKFKLVLLGEQSGKFLLLFKVGKTSLIKDI